MPHVSDRDARALAVRMYYIEVSNGMSPTDALTNVNHNIVAEGMLLWVWVELWAKKFKDDFYCKGLRLPRTLLRA